MGPINSENILAVFLLNALCEDFQDLQSTIQATSSDPVFSVNYIIERIENEEALGKHRVEQGITNGIPDTALITSTNQRGHKFFCENWQSIEDAIAAQRAALNIPPGNPNTSNAPSKTQTNTSSAAQRAALNIPPVNPNTSNAPSKTRTNTSPIFIHGVAYYPHPFTPEATPTTHFASLASPFPNPSSDEIHLSPGDLYEYHAF
ncbi:hypothetical protein BC827DRAFT_1271713 [Russula dissimulans]|nr:hypothetical protein BC827DRAFT_1271713 [Russula dissimulans]